MNKMVKHTIESFGTGTADLARWFGSNTADVAHRFGNGTVDVARRIGPRRGIIGLVALAAVIGGSIVAVRMIRARRARRANGVHDDVIDDTSLGSISRGGRGRGAESNLTY